jgi:hypothetical protein
MEISEGCGQSKHISNHLWECSWHTSRSGQTLHLASENHSRDTDDTVWFAAWDRFDNTYEIETLESKNWEGCTAQQLVEKWCIFFSPPPSEQELLAIKQSLQQMIESTT